jgi:hypothetical protein
LNKHHASSRREVSGTRFQAFVAQELVALGLASRAEAHENHRSDALWLSFTILVAIPDRCLERIGQ